MKIVEKSLAEIIPYDNNPRRNEDAVDAVAKSISEFGFDQPLVLDKDNVIIVGHTRYKAAEKLGLKTVPCYVVDLPPEKARAYRLADNKVAEKSGWDYEKLQAELGEIENIDMTDFGFEEIENDVIGSLMEDGFRSDKKDPTEFAVTFSFPIDAQDDMDEYIKGHGKSDLVDLMINYVREHKDD